MLGLNKKIKKFRPIVLKNKADFEKPCPTKDLYSDFNFTSVYTWNLNNTHGYVKHKKNLIIRLDDYVTGDPILSVSGVRNVDKTIEAAINFSREEFSRSYLKLVPEETVNKIKNKDAYLIEEDIDNFDYVYSLKEVAEYKGNKFKSKRQASARCEKNYNIIFTKHDDIDDRLEEKVLRTLESWAEAKSRTTEQREDSEEEVKALVRVFHNFNKEPNLILHLAWHEEKLVGFSIDEFEIGRYVLAHYSKTLPEYKGLTEYFNKYLAQEFLNKGYSYWNWEQDTGNDKLRRLKSSYRPIHFCRKYTVAKITEFHS